jgi:ATP:cob(I)alamin adenosyltransferase
MKIYTKGGDGGQTSLIGGTRVAKNHPRVAAYGDVDELNAALGMIRAMLLHQSRPGPAALAEALQTIQTHLMSLSAHLANDGSFKLPPLPEENITFLEQAIDGMQEVLPPLKTFVLPGPPLAAAQCQWARTICRRAERAIISFEDETIASNILRYINRLSDYLFVLGRFICLKTDTPESFWFPQK